ncbi:MAG TPA: ubiquinol-cytochrome C chaperone family protein [Stellaceae bacterium]|nr:ubiquinol-cytochrome C chaperone family protein [Stellaceae bacterium]
MTLGLGLLARRRERRAAVTEAYRAIVERARDPALFLRWGVPDTLDGRFELLALHAFLVLRRLKAAHGEAHEFAQALFDTMFADLDRAVREMGATDIGVGRHVKEMARGFYGRVAAYEGGLAGGEAELNAALERNLFGTGNPTSEQVAFAASYLRQQEAALAAVPLATILGGAIPFAPLPD